jgi:hypothetical protein
LGEVGIGDNYPVAIEPQLPDVVAVLSHVADNGRVVRVEEHMLVPLTGRVDTQVRHGHPSHKKVDGSGLAVQVVAAYGHRVGGRRAAEIAIQSSGDCRHIATGSGQIRGPAVLDIAGPMTARIAAKVEAAASQLL